MNAREAAGLLSYIAVFDNREVTREKAEVWADFLPDWVTPEIGVKATKAYFAEAASGPNERTYFDPRLFMYWAQKVRREDQAEWAERLKMAGARVHVELAQVENTNSPLQLAGGMAAIARMAENFGKENSDEK